jgi:hypothetical protein
MWYSNLEKNIYISTYPPPTLIHLSHRFTSASKPAAQKSFDCCLSHFRTWSAIICDFRTSWGEILDPAVNRFKRQTLSTVNRKHFFMNILCIEYFHPHKTHNRTLLFRSILSQARSPFWLWKPASVYAHALCYLDCHEAVLCCYLVLHI